MKFMGTAITGLAKNKNVQRAALNTGYNLGLGMAKRIQQRRQKRGKVQLFRNVQAAQPRRVMGQQNNAPIRMQTTQASVPAASSAREQSSGVVTTISSGLNDAPTIHSILVNPASPDFNGRLAKTASLYQKFKCSYVRFRYLPTVGTTQNGQLFFAFQPDPQTPAPENLDQLTTLGGQSQGVVSQPATVSVQTAALNRAFATNYTGEGDAAINSVGRLNWCVANTGGTAVINMGTLYVDYGFVFTDPKLSYTDQVMGAMTHTFSNVGLIDLTDGTVTKGVLPFEDTEVAGVYRKKGRQESLMVIAGSSPQGAAPVITVEYGLSPYALAELLPTHTLQLTTGEIINTYLIPSGEAYLNAVTSGGHYWANLELWLAPVRS